MEVASNYNIGSNNFLKFGFIGFVVIMLVLIIGGRCIQIIGVRVLWQFASNYFRQNNALWSK